MKENKIMFFLLVISVGLFELSCKKASGTKENEAVPEVVVPVKPDDNATTPLNEIAIAFPGAEGFGKDITGGRGGKVIKVTNLNDSGVGSFRAAVEASGTRIIVFDVAGTIELNSSIDLRNPNITIAGQSAPGDGITLKNYPFVVKAGNVIIRYLRFRMGDEKDVEADALGGFEGNNILVDHCSMSWSSDECVSFYNNDNFTMQWCIISESLRMSAHDKGAHGYGGVWGGKNASFHHNLMAHHDSRTPRFGEREGTAYALTDLVDVRNNVFYNWGNNGAYGGEAMNINIINNYYKPGPATKYKDRIFSPNRYSKNVASSIYNTWGKFYINGNYVEGRTSPTAENWTYGVYNQIHSGEGVITDADKTAMKLTNPLPINNNVTTHSAQDAYTNVLKYAGASLKQDDVDKRIIETVKNGTFTANGSSGDAGSKNGIIDKATDVSGWPFLSPGLALIDNDKDGMPDQWEIANNLNPNSANANGRDLSTGYDNIEVYLNSLVKDITQAQVK